MYDFSKKRKANAVDYAAKAREALADIQETDEENVSDKNASASAYGRNDVVASQIKSIIVEKLNVDATKVKPEASFINDLGADSLDTVELIMEFEKAFGINIPDDQAEKIATVGDAIAYIKANTL